MAGVLIAGVLIAEVLIAGRDPRGGAMQQFDVQPAFRAMALVVQAVLGDGGFAPPVPFAGAQSSLAAREGGSAEDAVIAQSGIDVPAFSRRLKRWRHR